MFLCPLLLYTDRLHCQLRQATLILPSGKRVKKNVTFGPSHGFDGANVDGPSDESSPLLGEQASQPASRTHRIFSQAKILTEQAYTLAFSETGRGVFKCSIAYLLGSMATFVPQIAALLGQQDGKHMVATITVYFHPARSIGSMFEAMICAALAFIYAVFICFSSMGVSIFFGKTLDSIVLGHVVILIVFCGGGLGLVGWVKQWLGSPLVNVACSLTSLAIITVLTKEGAVQAAEFSDDKVTQVMIMIVMGVLATTAVSFLISPVSARKGLRDDLVQVTDSFGDLLTMITRGFLEGEEEELKKQEFLDAENKYKKVFTSLTKNLKEAKYEHFVMGTEKVYLLEAKLVNCMQRLAQNIGGLRSAATTQFLLLAQPDNGGSAAHDSGQFEGRIPSIKSTTAGSNSPSELSHSVLASIDETPEDDSEGSQNTTRHPFLDFDDPLPAVGSPSDIFTRFVVQLGPSIVRKSVVLR